MTNLIEKQQMEGTLALEIHEAINRASFREKKQVLAFVTKFKTPIRYSREKSSRQLACSWLEMYTWKLLEHEGHLEPRH